LSKSCNFYWCWWQFTGELAQFFCRNRNGTRSFDISCDFGADGYIQVGHRKPYTAVSCLDQDIRQDREGCLRGNARRDGVEPFLKLLTRDRKSHPYSLTSEEESKRTMSLVGGLRVEDSPALIQPK